MRLLDSMRHGRILQAAPEGKEALFREIARLVGADDRVSELSEDSLTVGLLEREKQASTAIGSGIAIPHCQVAGLKEFVAGVLIIPKGMDYDASDGKPVRIVVFIFAPQDRRNEHVALLASLSRILSNEKALQGILSCQTDGEILPTLVSFHSPSSIVEPSQEKSLLHILIQREDIFTDVMEVTAEAALGAITVVEGRSARSYLNRMPLYAGFWTDEEDLSVRLIVAVVSQPMCNELARKIMLLAQEEGRQCKGVLILAQDIAMVVGDVEF